MQWYLPWLFYDFVVNSSLITNRCSQSCQWLLLQTESMKKRYSFKNCNVFTVGLIWLITSKHFFTLGKIIHIYPPPPPKKKKKKKKKSINIIGFVWPVLREQHAPFGNCGATALSGLLSVSMWGRSPPWTLTLSAASCTAFCTSSWTWPLSWAFSVVNVLISRMDTPSSSTICTHHQYGASSLCHCYIVCPSTLQVFEVLKDEKEDKTIRRIKLVRKIQKYKVC